MESTGNVQEWGTTQRGTLKTMHRYNFETGRTVCNPPRIMAGLRTRSDAEASGLRMCPSCLKEAK